MLADCVHNITNNILNIYSTLMYVIYNILCYADCVHNITHILNFSSIIMYVIYTIYFMFCWLICYVSSRGGENEGRKERMKGRRREVEGMERRRNRKMYVGGCKRNNRLSHTI